MTIIRPHLSFTQKLDHSSLQMIMFLFLPSGLVSFTVNSKPFSLTNHVHRHNYVSYLASWTSSRFSFSLLSIIVTSFTYASVCEYASGSCLTSHSFSFIHSLLGNYYYYFLILSLSHYFIRISQQAN